MWKLRCDVVRVGIELTGKAYLPEAYAYQSYLINNGVSVELAPIHDLSSNNDLIITFMGFKKNQHKAEYRVIHEYHSLSTPPMARAKDSLKRYLNFKPNGRIFLNDKVERIMSFKDNIPCIYRDMGVNDDFISLKSKKISKQFDIVYAGSINRKGLLKTVIDISKLGYKIVLVGNLDNIDRSIYEKNGVTLSGELSRKEISNIYSLSNAGLNFTPDLYPYNIQTSTKTLEYLSAGLSLISNKYYWIESFSKAHNIKPIWLEDLNSNYKLGQYTCNFDPEWYRWSNVLNRSNFMDFVMSVYSKS
jgi:hypothetical protein